MSDFNNGSSGPGWMTTFASGALVGAAITVLFAPKSGKQTRELVANKAHELKDSAGDAIERGKHFVNEVKHKAGEAFEKGKELADEAKNDAGQVMDKGKEVVNAHNHH